MEKALAYLESSTNPTESTPDEYDIFGKHIAAELKSTSSLDARRWAKLQIQTIIFRAQTESRHLPTPPFRCFSTQPPLHQNQDPPPLSSYSDDGSFGSGLSYD